MDVDRKKILVVDDEQDQVAIIKKQFEAVGYEVAIAYDGEEAISKVRAAKPDLIILDVMMPGINGYEVCAILGREENYKNIPVIMLTAQRKAEDIKKGMDAGVVSYVQKPFKMAVLVGITKGILG
jgi:CheY-like chemotaxis protein